MVGDPERTADTVTTCRIVLTVVHSGALCIHVVQCADGVVVIQDRFLIVLIFRIWFRKGIELCHQLFRIHVYICQVRFNSIERSTDLEDLAFFTIRDTWRIRETG